MATTEEMFKFKIKETCAEIRHVQSMMNAIVVSYIEDALASDTETGDTETVYIRTEKLRHDMMLSLRHYQDTLFATITLLHRKYDRYSRKLRAKLDSMDKTCPDIPNDKVRPIM